MTSHVKHSMQFMAQHLVIFNMIQACEIITLFSHEKHMGNSHETALSEEICLH